eukprot:GEMP01076616.1.p1 GENE.GEMP01076616.1~~GEMP01076616.1.p1  ORF type:complete len:167 (+),score=12.82 GEMP01076616.1:247-747(+)
MRKIIMSPSKKKECGTCNLLYRLSRNSYATGTAGPNTLGASKQSINPLDNVMNCRLLPDTYLNIGQNILRVDPARACQSITLPGQPSSVCAWKGLMNAWQNCNQWPQCKALTGKPEHDFWFARDGTGSKDNMAGWSSYKFDLPPDPQPPAASRGATLNLLDHPHVM